MKISIVAVQQCCDLQPGADRTVGKMHVVLIGTAALGKVIIMAHR
nr:hypothetical protein [Candidatus Microthrix sp.]